MMNDNDSETEKQAQPTVKTRTKLMVILIITLIMSSGILYYFDTSSIEPDNPYLPFLYYGVLSLMVGLIILLLYTSFNILYAKPDLFSTNEIKEGDDTTSEGLKNVLEAERKYKDKQKHSEFRPMDKKPVSNTKSTRRNVKKEKVGSRLKLGSIPMEETIFTEKLDLPRKGENEKITQKTKKVTTFLCPSCGSKELYYEAGLISGYKYHCKDCDYIGSFVIEKDFKVKDE